ncbi:MAG: hypothetical protein RSB54_02790 [Bacilli bacterium]
MEKIVNMLENLYNTNWFVFWDKVGNIATGIMILISLTFVIACLYAKLDNIVDRIYRNKKAKKA